MLQPIPTTIRHRYDYALLEVSKARIARAAEERIAAHQRGAVIEIGRELLLVKEALEHGEFLNWVERACGFGRRTANNLMHVAEHFGEPDKWEIVSHLPNTVLYQLCSPATPDSLRAQVLDVSGDRVLETRALERTLKEQKMQRVFLRKQQNPLATKSQVATARRKSRELESNRAAAQARIDRAASAARMITEVLSERMSELREMLADMDDFYFMRILKDDVSGFSRR